MQVQRQTWEEVQEHFSDLPGESMTRKTMLPLVEYLAESEIGSYLFPWISMYDLRITQALHYPSDGPHLVISSLRDGQLEFRYIDTFRKDRQWSRVVPASSANARFEKFVEQLHWLQSSTRSES